MKYTILEGIQLSSTAEVIPAVQLAWLEDPLLGERLAMKLANCSPHLLASHHLYQKTWGLVLQLFCSLENCSSSASTHRP